MKIKIDKGVPIPLPRNRHPWAEMETDDSFELPVGRSGQSSVQGAGNVWCRRNRPDHKIVTRITSRGTRYWMVKKEPDDED